MKMMKRKMIAQNYKYANSRKKKRKGARALQKFIDNNESFELLFAENA